MMRLKSWRFVVIANLAAATGCAILVACTGDDSTDLLPGTDASTTKDTGVTPGNDTGVDNPDTSVTPQGEPPGCFTGTPVNTLDFQNACTTAAYVIFDNCARIGYCDGGTLPPLVSPPVDAGPDTSTPADTGAGDTGADSADTSVDAADGG